MLYEIISTDVSGDKNVCYFIFRHKVRIGDESADTYGISAAGISECRSVCDVVTDENDILKLLETVSRDSVPVIGLEEYVINYISNM